MREHAQGGALRSAGHSTTRMGTFRYVSGALALRSAGRGTTRMGTFRYVKQAPKPCSTWNSMQRIGTSRAAGQAPKTCSTWNSMQRIGTSRSAGQAPQLHYAGRELPGKVRKYRKVPTFAECSTLRVLRLIVKLSKNLYYGSTSKHVASRSKEEARRHGVVHPGRQNLAEGAGS